MQLSELKVPPFNSTLMGVVRSVSDYYELGWSDPMIYGGSGHAFMVNIHESLCPSGPYCWNRAPFYALLSNLGIRLTDQGFFSNDSTPQQRSMVEDVLRKHLDQGNPCGLVNMEYQLISGHDETGFFTSQPWECNPGFPPRRLTFSSWAEMGDQIHVNFFTFDKTAPAVEKTMIIDSLNYARDVYDNPSAHTSGSYATGAAAFDMWIRAVQVGHGSSHGMWWNATVWGECRAQASAYLMEIAENYPAVSDATRQLAADYRTISENLLKASNKELPAQEQVRLLREAGDIEIGCIRMMDCVMSGLGC